MDYPFETLPDLLGPGPLGLVFVGINPSAYAVQQGHYFARRQNRFWSALSLSRLGRPICEGLGVERLEPRHDVELPRFGIGLTDVVKIPTANASGLTPEMFREWAPRLVSRLEACGPRRVCFQGLTGYRPFLKHALGRHPGSAHLGFQDLEVAGARVFVVPNPSAANAQYSLEDLVTWYDRLAEVPGR